MSKNPGASAHVDENILPTRMSVIGGNDVVAIRQHESRDTTRQARFEVSLLVGVESESNFYVGFTENLSEGGVFVATHSLKGVGAECDLMILLPDQSTICATGRVRWIRQYSGAEGTHPGMGIRFDQICERDVELIREFTRSRAPIFFDEEVLQSA